MSCNAFFSSLSGKRKHFLWCWYCGKKQIEMWFIMVCTLTDNKFMSLLIPQTLIFLYCFCILSEFVKVFQRKVLYKQLICLMQRVHFPSLSRCFQLSRQIFILLSWSEVRYCGKKQIEWGLAQSVLLSTMIRIITVVKMLCNKLSYITECVLCFSYWVRQQHTPMDK